MEQFIVLSADQWRFTDPDSGEIRAGVSLHCVTDYRDPTDTSVGFKPMKMTGSDAAFLEIKKGGAPGLYELSMRSRPGKDGVPTMQVVGARLLKKLDIFPKA